MRLEEEIPGIGLIPAFDRPHRQLERGMRRPNIDQQSSLPGSTPLRIAEALRGDVESDPVVGPWREEEITGVEREAPGSIGAGPGKKIVVVGQWLGVRRHPIPSPVVLHRVDHARRHERGPLGECCGG